MAAQPYKFFEKRSAFGWSNNQLIEAASQNNQRKAVPLVDLDTYRNISPLGRRTLLSTSRILFENFGIIKGAIEEQARLSVETFIPQFEGEDEAWGDEAEFYLNESGKYLDIQGDPHNYESFKRMLPIATLRDGAQGVLLTENEAGQPQIQPIPCHRVGSSDGCQFVEYPTEWIRIDGRVIDNEGRDVGNVAWQGFRICDGVILNNVGKRVAYRLIPDSGFVSSGIYRDVSANDFIFRFLPNYCDQVREIPPLAVCAFDSLDVKESRRNEMFAQLVNSCLVLQIFNETGDVDTAKSALTVPTSTPDETTGAATSLPSEAFLPGTIQYLKAGSGQKIESMVNNRPSVNVMNFQSELIRSAMCGMGWSTDFSVDPSKVGGAQMRIVIEKINAKIREIQKFIVAPMLQRIDSWRIAKAIKLGILPPNKDWFRWSYQGPEELTADEKYSSDVALQEFRGGPGTMRRWSAKRGSYWKDDYIQKIKERKFLETEAALAGVNPDKVILLTPNGNVAPEQGQQKDEKPEETK